MGKLILAWLKENIKKKWKAYIVISIVWVVFLSVYIPFSTEKAAERIYGYSTDTRIAMNGGDLVQQTFTSPFEGLSYIRLFFYNDTPETEHELEVEIYRISGGGMNLFIKTFSIQQILPMQGLSLKYFLRTKRLLIFKHI